MPAMGKIVQLLGGPTSPKLNERNVRTAGVAYGRMCR